MRKRSETRAFGPLGELARLACWWLGCEELGRGLQGDSSSLLVFVLGFGSGREMEGDGPRACSLMDPSVSAVSPPCLFGARMRLVQDRGRCVALLFGIQYSYFTVSRSDRSCKQIFQDKRCTRGWTRSNVFYLMCRPLITHERVWRYYLERAAIQFTLFAAV